MIKNKKRILLIILAIPTFLAPAMMLFLSLWCIAGELSLVAKLSANTIENVEKIVEWIIYLLWPIYISWAFFTKLLKKEEKIGYCFIIIFLNIIGIPWFYIEMMRRYKGKFPENHPLDIKSAEEYLEKNGLKKEYLSKEQWEIIVKQMRKKRYTVFNMVFTIFILIFGAYVIINNYVVMKDIIDEFAPTKIIVVDENGKKLKTYNIEKEYFQNYTTTLIAFGFCEGISFGFIFISILSQIELWKNQKLFNEFVKNRKKNKPFPACQ